MIDETPITLECGTKLLELYHRQEKNIKLQLVLNNYTNFYNLKILNIKHNLVIIASTLEEYFEILIMYKELDNSTYTKQ